MTETLEALERRIDGLRSEVRRAAISGDPARARALRAELRRAEHDWEEELAQAEAEIVSPGAASTPAQQGPLLPLREQVHHALTLLTVPAAPRLIISVYEAFFSGEMIPARLTSLRRDEEKSFRSAPNARPYYLCAALTADLLSPARGLLAVSTWTMAERIVGPLSSRVHYLTAAIQVAERVALLDSIVPTARRLLWRFAGNIPGAVDGSVTPAGVAKAARAELVIHEEADRAEREAAAARAAAQLDPVDQLFGTSLRALRKKDAG